MQADKKVVTRVEKDADYIVMDIDLEDLPHGELLFSKERENGTSVDFYKAIPGLEVLSYDEGTGRPVWATVSNWSHHKGCRLEIVNLSNGDQMFTDDDPRAVYGLAFDAKSLIPERFTPSEALRRKVMVPCTTLANIPVDGHSWYDFTDHQLVRILPAGHIGYELTFEFGQVIGSMAGDGWWAHDEVKSTSIRRAKKGSIRLADSEGFTATFIRKWIADMFPDTEGCWYCAVAHSKDMDPSRYGDSITHTFSFPGVRTFRAFLTESLGGERDADTAGSGNKHLPLWMAGAPKEFKLGMLNGLMATDGCICTSGAKGKAQLMISICSTSLRLLRDAQALCRWLGISSAITHCKKTTRGNDAWLLSLSTPDCKKTDVFSRLCHERKKEIFLTTEVSDMSQHARNTWVPYPRLVHDLIMRYFVLPNITPTLRKAATEEARRKKEWHSLYQSLFQKKDAGYITKDTVGRLVSKFEEKVSGHKESRVTVASFIADMKIGDPINRERGLAVRAAINDLSAYLQETEVRKALALLSRHLRRNDVYSLALQGALLKVSLPSDFKFTSILDDEGFAQWVDLCKSPFNWYQVVDVEKTDTVVEGFDLTVPGYDTFASDRGVILSNTMTYYVPVSDRAVNEAVDKMLPSKNLLAARDFTAHYLPQEEIVLGAYLASRPGKGPLKKTFRTKAEAVRAWRAGEVDLNDNIQILEE